MVPADSRRIPRVLRYSGAASLRLDGFGYGAVTLSGRASLRVLLPSRRQFAGGPATPRGALLRPRFGLLRFRSPLLAESLLFSFPAGTEMFQFPAFAPASAGDGIAPAGFPHSEIRASTGICPLTRLFAAYHVLLRLREPQASPVRPYLLSFLFFAFSNMTFSRFSFGLLRLAPVDLAFRPARLLLSSPDCLRGLRPVAVSFRFALPSCQ